MKVPLTEGWELRWQDPREPQPSSWIPATVPGTVQQAWAASEGLGPWWKAKNALDYLWMEDIEWHYRLTLPEVELAEGQSLFIEAEQVEYRGRITLGGVDCGDFRGPAAGFLVDLTSPYREGARDLIIEISPAPFRRSEFPEDPPHRELDTQTTKPGMYAGWDFAPRLIPLGLTKPVHLKAVGPASLGNWITRTQVDPERRSAEIHLLAEAPSGHVLDWSLSDPSGKKAAEARLSPGQWHTLPLEELQLWQPNGWGSQPLYRETLVLCDGSGTELDRQERTLGFRSLRLTQYEGQWDEPQDFPLSRREPPITLEVNGRRIFAKGSNWVPPDQLPSLTTPERVKELVGLAKEAGFNILRVWGGGGAPPESFFEACDEAGILVWQEFPLACARYEGTPIYLERLEVEAKAMIKRFRSHPSLAFWCGGNELFNSWSRMDDQDLPLRLLNKVCYEEDPWRPFLATSPLMGMGHGNYTFVDLATGREVHEVFGKARCTAYTEYGSSGAASLKTLEEIIPEEELWPPLLGTSWDFHKALEAWDGTEHSWLMLPTLKSYFGEAESLEELVGQSQTLQAEGLRFIYEEARRQAPRCSMALCWCFNEPWPTAANSSIVSWPAVPKPAFRAVQAACRPTALTLRAEKFSWAAGEEFQAHIILLHEGEEPAPDLKVTAKVNGEEAWSGGVSVGQPALLTFRVPNGKQGQPFLVQLNEDRHYTFVLSSS